MKMKSKELMIKFSVIDHLDDYVIDSGEDYFQVKQPEEVETQLSEN